MMIQNSSNRKVRLSYCDRLYLTIEYLQWAPGVEDKTPDKCTTVQQISTGTMSQLDRLFLKVHNWSLGLLCVIKNKSKWKGS